MKKYFAIPSNYRLEFNGSIARTDIPATLSAYYGCRNRDEVFAKHGHCADAVYWAIKYLSNPVSFEQKKDAIAYAKENGLIVAFKSHGFLKHIDPSTII
jgi:hypothetical protein